MSPMILALAAAWADDPDRLAELEARIAALEAKVADMQRAPAVAPRPSPEAEQAAAEMLREATTAAEALDYDTARAKLAELKSGYPDTRAAKAAGRLEDEFAVVGKAEIPLAVEAWLQGSLSDVEGGEATLYVFWESWCPHCRRELPKLSETYDQFRDQGLAMVGLTKLTRDTTAEDAMAFVTDNDVGFPIAREEGDVMSAYYGVRGIPAAAMVKDGEVVWRGHPARLTDEMIRGWL